MFERCLYFNLNSLTRKINRIWDQAFSEFELSPSHAYLLRLVLAEPGQSQKQLAKQLNLTKSTVTRFIDALESRQLVKRKKSFSDDAREQLIYPAAKARKLQQRLEATGEKLYKTMQDQLGPQDLIKLVKQLKIASSNF